MSSTVGKQLREARRKALDNKAAEVLHEMKEDVSTKVQQVILPKCLAAAKADPLAKSVRIPNRELGWDYMKFTWRDTDPRNPFMTELEAQCANHDLKVTYIMDWAINHLDRDSIEGIIVHWD